MLITQNFTWPTNTSWPSPTSPSTQYTVLQLFPTPQTVVLTESGSTSATWSFDDALSYVFQVRPSSGVSPSLAYGPEITTFVVNYVPCRSWLRQEVRKALADRADIVGANLNWPDDEINGYITQGINELNLNFPVEQSTRILMLPPSVDGAGNTIGTQVYPLPPDYYRIRTVEYVTNDEQYHRYLKEKPFRGGETTAQSILAYPKLGVMAPIMNGRFYPGHYFVYQNALNIDWDPYGDGDFINVTYAAKRPIPVDDGTLMNVTPEDMELLSLRTQMKCWLRVEGQDTRLSRWTTDKKRDDMPTVKHSTIIKQLYNELVNDRRELRPRTLRLVRR